MTASLSVTFGFDFKLVDKFGVHNTWLHEMWYQVLCECGCATGHRLVTPNHLFAILSGELNSASICLLLSLVFFI